MLILIIRTQKNCSNLKFKFLFRYGKIVSTKAIIDKTTNNCKGYGFVDFDSPVAAENAVKQLQIQGIECQMAKVKLKLI